MLHAISLGAAMAALWLLLSGFFTPLLLGLGLASVVLSVWIAHRMDVVDHEGHPIHLGPRAAIYFPWLVKEIIVSNWAVAKIILRPNMNIRPHVFDTKAGQASTVGQTTYANSITLTPGTVTLNMDDNGMLAVHALDDSAREGVESGVMNRRCIDMEGLKEPKKGAEGKS